MPATTLKTLQAMGLTLATDGRQLTVSPASKITDEARQLIRAHRDELLAELVPSANDELLFWRVEVRTPDGRRIEIDAPSGLNLVDAERWAIEDFGEGCKVSGLIRLDEALEADFQSETTRQVTDHG